MSSYLYSCFCCSVAKSCSTLWVSTDCSTSGSSVLHYLPEFVQTHVHRVSDPSNHLILCRPLLLLPSVFASVRVFSSESAVCIRWPKYWSFSFSEKSKQRTAHTRPSLWTTGFPGYHARHEAQPRRTNWGLGSPRDLLLGQVSHLLKWDDHFARLPWVHVC